MNRLICLLTLCVAAPLWAQQPDTPGAEAAPVGTVSSPLARITVTAARGQRLDLDVPASTSLLEADDLRTRRPARSFPSALQQVPGVMTQETAPGQGSPFVRGLTGYRVLTTVDGVRLNGSFFRAGPNQYLAGIDPLLVGEVEVVRGQGSVLHGSDALGGVLAVRSRDPEPPPDHEPGQPWVRVGGYLRYAQGLREGAEQSTTPRLEVMAGAGQFDLIGGFDTVHVGDRETGKHMKTARNSGYSGVNGDLKLRYRLTDQETVTAAFQRSELRNVPRSHSTVWGEPWRGLRAGSNLRRDLDQSHQLTYVELESHDRGPFARLKGNVSLQRTYENQDRTRSGGGETRTGFEVWTLGTYLEAESDLPFEAVDLTATYGLDYYHDFVDSFETDRGQRRPRGAIADDADYDLFGSFLQLELRTAVVDVFAGVRYSLARVVARDVDPDPSDAFPFGRLKETYDAILGSAGFVIHPIRELSLVGSVNQGFRAPNLSDTTSFEAVRSNSFDSPAPDLDEERTLTLEGGIKLAFPFVRAQAFYAYTFLDDFIQRVPTGNTVQGLQEFTKRNIGRGSIQAVEVSAELLVDEVLRAVGSGAPELGFTLRGRFSWVRGYVDTLQSATGDVTKDHLSRIPPARAAASLRWTEPGEGRWWAEVESEFVRHQTRLSPRDVGDTQRIPPGGTPSYALWHVRVGWDLWEGRLGGSVALENVFDQDYRVHGSGTNGAGRRVVMSLQALW